MFKCIVCLEFKDESEFYVVRNTVLGHDKNCKDCRKEKVRQYRLDNLEKVKEYDRNRPNHKERVEACQKRYQQKRKENDEEFIIKDRERVRAYRKQNPMKYKAQCKVNSCLKYGKIIRPEKCSCCGKQCKPQAHHWSYEEEHWLDVIWLCTRCHADEHNRLRAEGRDPDNNN